MNSANRRRRPSASQYEPLTTPEKWTGDEKRFALRLTQLMDELHEKQSALSRRMDALEKRMEEEDNNG